MAVICARIGTRTGEPGRASARLATSSRLACSSSRRVSAATSWSRISGLPGSVVLLGADGGQFTLDISADGRIGTQRFETPDELVAVHVELTGGELADRAGVVVVTHG
jgi:hypothetical protein